MKSKNLNKLIFGLFSVFVFTLFFFTQKQSESNKTQHPKPTKGKTQIFKGQEEGEGGNAKEAWLNLIHRAAPNTDWRAIDKQTRQDLFRKRNKNSAALRANEIFANGNLEGEWIELGSNNQAGNLTTIEYDKLANKKM